MNEKFEPKEIKCLDHGFVRLIDVMGDDDAIVQAARVSYGKGTKTVNEDRGLIRYLMRHRHTTPFEMVELKFHVKLPIFVARQWIRHRTANVNEMSGRYSEMRDEFYLPDSGQVRLQSKSNRQGREEAPMPLDEAGEIIGELKGIYDSTFQTYSGLLEKGLAREIARIALPVSNYTEWYWKIDLHNLFHFLGLRMDSHAQYEIRVYANAMAELVKPFVPFAWEAYEDYFLQAANFSRIELNILKDLINKQLPEPESLESYGLKKREALEFLDKLKK